MFCGWQLHTDFDAFAELGSGTLEINALDGTCKFNQSSINKLSIASVLNSWFIEDLKDNNIAISEVEVVVLSVHIVVRPPEYGNRFTSFSLNCKSKLISGTEEYASEYQDIQEFECK